MTQPILPPGDLQVLDPYSVFLQGQQVLANLVSNTTSSSHHEELQRLKEKIGLEREANAALAEAYNAEKENTKAQAAVIEQLNLDLDKAHRQNERAEETLNREKEKSKAKLSDAQRQIENFVQAIEDVKENAKKDLEKSARKIADLDQRLSAATDKNQDWLKKIDLKNQQIKQLTAQVEQLEADRPAVTSSAASSAAPEQARQALALIPIVIDHIEENPERAFKALKQIQTWLMEIANAETAEEK